MELIGLDFRNSTHRIILITFPSHEILDLWIPCSSHMKCSQGITSRGLWRRDSIFQMWKEWLWPKYRQTYTLHNFATIWLVFLPSGTGMHTDGLMRKQYYVSYVISKSRSENLEQLLPGVLGITKQKANHHKKMYKLPWQPCGRVPHWHSSLHHW